MKTHDSHSGQRRTQPVLSILASPTLEQKLSSECEPFSSDEINDFEMMYKVMNSHSDNKVAQMIYADMIDRDGYDNQRELFDRYCVFTERYHNGQ